MTSLIRRSRGLLIALAVLAITAGAVFATAPNLAPTGSPTVEEPTATPTATPTASPEDEDGDEDGDEDAAAKPEAPEATDAPESTESPTADTHGALVSTAAQMETPEGFANHGAFVSCVAHLKDVTLATVDWATITPDTCAAADASRDAAKAERKAAKAAERAERSAAKAARAAERAERKAAGRGAND